MACHCSTLLRLLSLVAAVLLLGWPGGMHMCCSSGWPCADAGGAGPAAAAVLWLCRRVERCCCCHWLLPEAAAAVGAAAGMTAGSAATASAAAAAAVPPQLPLTAPSCRPACCRKCTGHTNIVQLIEVFLTQRYLVRCACCAVHAVFSCCAGHAVHFADCHGTPRLLNQLAPAPPAATGSASCTAQRRPRSLQSHLQSPNLQSPNC